MTDEQNQTGSSNPTPTEPPVATAVDDTSNQTNITSKPTPEPESKEEKLRRAKIAMEGLDRTIRREATEKEEEASDEKQNLNKILATINHEKELLELTWVNLDDKRNDLKKILEPILAQEEAIQSEEGELESKEEVTLIPQERRAIEERRWQTQEKRKKIEEEKWLVEEKVQKIEAQISEIKEKYQNLLNQEEEVRNKIRAIDEQLLLQQEVLRQQHELEEQKRRQEALRLAEEEKKREEAKRRELEEAKRAEEARRQEEAKRMASAQAQATTSPADTERQKLEKLRQAEEEKQKQEAEKLRQDQARAEELKNKLAQMMPPSPQEKVDPEKHQLELERIKRENKEAEQDKATNPTNQKVQSIIDSIKQGDSSLKPLRTFQADMAEAMKNNPTTQDNPS